MCMRPKIQQAAPAPAPVAAPAAPVLPPPPQQPLALGIPKSAPGGIRSLRGAFRSGLSLRRDGASGY